jgi:hypothetical protein
MPETQEDAVAAVLAEAMQLGLVNPLKAKFELLHRRQRLTLWISVSALVSALAALSVALWLVWR